MFIPNSNRVKKPLFEAMRIKNSSNGFMFKCNSMGFRKYISKKSCWYFDIVMSKALLYDLTAGLLNA